MNPKDVKKLWGAAAVLLLGTLLWNAPLGMEPAAQRCLALSVGAVALWGVRVMDAGMGALALLLGYVLCFDRSQVPLSEIFGLWTKPMMYLVISGFLIAEAVKSSGLGERLALNFLARFVSSYRGVIASCYILAFLLSFMIPHPWPRSFLLMSIMSRVIADARLSPRYAAAVGMAVFAGSVPTAAILITGDSTLNAAAVGFAGEPVSWLRWAVYMGVPAVFASAATCGLQLLLIGKAPQFSLDGNLLKSRAEALGPLSPKERYTAAVLALTLLAWACDWLHGLDPAWIGAAAVIVLSMPGLGSLDGASWKSVPLNTLLFLCAALALGGVGKATGMNAWIAETLTPAGLSSSPLAFALFAWGFCTGVHMLLGSCLSALGIAVPAVLAFAQAAAIPPLVAVMICYFSVTLHWIMPFHHINLLVGLGASGGGYSDADVVRFGVPQTAVALATVLLGLFWWKLLGLL